MSVYRSVFGDMWEFVTPRTNYDFAGGELIALDGSVLPGLSTAITTGGTYGSFAPGLGSPLRVISAVETSSASTGCSAIMLRSTPGATARGPVYAAMASDSRSVALQLC
jgi:hypothetical protein